MAQIPYHKNFSTFVNLLKLKQVTPRFWQEGFLVCGVKLNNEVWSLDRKTNTGAVFNLAGTLMRGVCTNEKAVEFVKPEDMTAEDAARYTAFLPKKL